LLVTAKPTAQALLGEVAATPKSLFELEPRFGLGWTFQALPSQCSTSVRQEPVFPSM
jgi:hypothetical protein